MTTGWDHPDDCANQLLAEMLVDHLAMGNAGNFEDIGCLAMMLHQRRRSNDPCRSGTFAMGRIPMIATCSSASARVWPS